jgi:hypothetical protein
MTSKSIHLVFAALTLTACMDTAPAGAIPEIDDTLILKEVWSPVGATTSILDPGFEPVDLPGSACACETAGCVADWVTATVGCGICIDLHCADGGVVGACVPCGEDVRVGATDGSIGR